MAVVTPTAPTPTAPTPETAPSDTDESNGKRKQGQRKSIKYPVPTGPDGSIIQMEFFPSEENRELCEKLGGPVYDPDIHVKPASGYFKGSHIKLYWEASELHKEADAKLREAKYAEDHPTMSKDVKSIQNHLDAFLKLKGSIEAQGGDTSNLEATIRKAMGLDS